jgi:hypothetical protein
VLSNTASTNPENQHAWGGGVYIYNGGADIGGNRIQGNLGHVAYSGSGGGVYLSGLSSAFVWGNTITGNFGSLGDWRSDAGGLWIDHSSSVLVGSNRIEGNATSGHPTQGAGFGGGVYIWESDVDLTGNLIVGNSAGTWQNAQRAGGGIAVQSTIPVTISNNLVANNVGGPWDGGGVHVGLSWAPGSQAILVNNTIVNNGHNAIQAFLYAHLSLTNNLISGHEVGVYTTTLFTGSVTADTNLFWNESDPIVGVNAIQQAPLLTPDFHLRDASPALDAGLTIPWLVHDLDGESRPQGSAYDIGAYEGAEIVWDVFVPLVWR